MARYKLVALDLDGTLLNSAMKLSEANGAAIQKAMEQGVQVVLATARWYALALRTAGRLGIETPLICCNGAIVKRPTDGAELLHLHVDEELAREAVTMADDAGWEMYTTIGDSTYMKMRPGVVPEMLPAGLKVAERQSNHLAEGPATSVLIYGTEAVDAAVERLMPKYGDRARFSLNRPVNTSHYVILTHPEAEKARGLQMVCDELGIAPDEAVAMGDSESDLAMLSMAGLGIAMGNSPDEVRKAALHIAPSNDEDGVAWALERFVLA
jgi:Cof subfamily protein (haloacid dehalogenase superfamily)